MKDNQSEKVKKAKKRPVKAIFTALIIILALAACAYIVLDTLAGEQSIGEYLRDFTEKETVRSEKFSFDAYSDNLFEELNGGIVAVSAAAYQVFDDTGEIVGRGAKALSSPAVASGPGGAVLWSQGGKDVMRISAEGATKSLDSENSVIAASINDSGYVAVSSEQSGYKGLVTVYDESGEAVYKWFSGSAYLVDAAVNSSNTGMSALTIGESGSRLVAYSFGSEDEQGAYRDAETIFFDMDYISENRICAVGENKAVFVNGKCEYNAEYSFEGRYLRDYSLEGNGFAVFVLGKYMTGGEAVIVSVDGSGELRGSIDAAADIKAISVRGKYIAVTYSDSAVLYNAGLEEVGRVENAAGIEKALACADGKLIAVSANGAVEYDF